MQDDELIRIILKGDGERYDDIVERYQAGLYRTAFYYTQNEEDARDITQENDHHLWWCVPNQFYWHRFSDSFSIDTRLVL